jgi:hypothetical protein
LDAPGAALLLARSAHATTLYYSSCAERTTKFHHGVAKGHRAALYQVRQGYGMPAYGPLAQKVYWKTKCTASTEAIGAMSAGLQAGSQCRSPGSRAAGRRWGSP